MQLTITPNHCPWSELFAANIWFIHHPSISICPYEGIRTHSSLPFTWFPIVRRSQYIPRVGTNIDIDLLLEMNFDTDMSGWIDSRIGGEYSVYEERWRLFSVGNWRNINAKDENIFLSSSACHVEHGHIWMPSLCKYWQIFMNPNGFGACVGRMYCLIAYGD